MNDRLKGVRIITDKVIPLLSLHCRTQRGRADSPSSHSPRTNEIPFTRARIALSLAASSGLGHDHPLVLCGQRCLLEYTTTTGEVRYDKKSDWVCEQVAISLNPHA